MQKLRCILFFYLTGFLFLGMPSIVNGQTLTKEEVDSLQYIIKTSSNDSARGRALNKLGFHYTFIDIDKALPLIERGLKEAEQYQLLFGKAELLNTKAIYFDVLGEKDSAIYFFGQSMTLSRKHNFYNIEVLTLNGLGLFYWKSGKFEEALSCFFQALEMGEEKFPDQEDNSANYLSNIGLIYQELGQYSKSIEYHKKALAIREKLELLNGQAISYANLGVCYENLEQYDKSEQFYKQAIEKAEAAKNWRMYYALQGNIGNIYSLTERNERAIAAYKKALDKPAHVGANPKSDLSAYINLASLYNKLEQPRTSMQYAEKGFSLLKQYPQLYNFSEGLHYAYAESNYLLGNVSEGSKSMLNYKNVLDSVFSEKNALALAETEKKYESAQKDKAIAEQHLVIVQKEKALAQRSIWLVTVVLLSFTVAITAWFVARRRKALVQIQEEQKVNHAIFESEQKERVRIARDLHDSIGQKLSVMKMLLSKSDEAVGEIKKISDYLDETAKEVRSISHNLMPEVLNLGFAKALESLIEQINEGEKINAGLEITNEARKLTLPRQTEVSLYRIVQEIIGNIVRHAQTDKIFIRIFTEENFLQIIIRDNGVGFDANAVDESEGLGWKNIFARIRLVNGQLKIKSQPNTGSEFFINIPLV